MLFSMPLCFQNTENCRLALVKKDDLRRKRCRYAGIFHGRESLSQDSRAAAG